MTATTEFLAGRGVQYEVLAHGEAHTAAAEASTLHAGLSDVVKTIILIPSSGPVLAVYPAARRLDLKRARAVLADGHVRLATEGEVSRLIPDCQLGAIPPLPSVVNMPVYVDPEVMERRSVIIAAGTATLSVRAAPEDLFSDEPVRRIVPLAARPEEEEARSAVAPGLGAGRGAEDRRLPRSSTSAGGRVRRLRLPASGT